MRMKVATVLLLCVLPVYLLRAQTSTYEGRQLFGTFADSTLTKYFLERIVLQTPSSYSFVGFNSTDSFGTGYLRSNNFTTAGTPDTLAFFRYAAFDMLPYAEADIPVDADSNAIDSIADAIAALAVGRTVAPQPTAFSAVSRLRFITRLHSAATNSSLLTIDTLTCFYDTNRGMRYVTSKNLPARVKLGMPSSASTGPVYLKVEVEASSAGGMTWEGHGYGGDITQESAAVMTCNNWQDNCDPAAALKEASSQFRDAPLYEVDGLVVHPNPAYSTIQLRLTSGKLGACAINIVDAKGDVVLTRMLSAKDLPAINISSLPQGFYIAFVKTLNQLVSCHFVKK